ncbi:radical SAM additional 4Fe4S-binding SPASM domain-containing protein [Enterococcus casseliflavus EC20]|uniref:Radical SAM additional 4Fe4S-binding SPASM domain-containing protein n=1 Tax=Enterococcus casseliflavus EC20 TaxID=565655 RepID=C9A5B8_ENTCA|nr:radical SAM protein [Enterococcus casseliflavus]EEV37810.2 radical SAM additional 4Fe4S-binding SPASM domain-containing protein [Enterococcus casseliflavus EC20]
MIEKNDNGIYSVRISLDGNEFEHNQMRGNRNSFKNAVNAITLLKNKDLNPEIFFVPTKKNKHCLPFIMDFGKNIGVKVNVRRFMPYGRGAENTTLLLSSEDVADLFHVYEKHYYGNSTFDKCYTIAEKRGNCKLCIQSTAAINIDGNVFSCPFFQEKKFCLGNINDNSLKDILDNLHTSPLMSITDDQLSSKCQKCDIFSLCRGGCRGSAYILSGGDIYSDDPQCAYQLTKY